MARGRHRGGDLRRGRGRAADLLQRPAAEAAGAAGDGHRRHRRGHGQLHGAVDEAPLARPAQGPGGRGRPRTDRGLGLRAGADGLPRGAARGLRDLGLPAGDLQRERQPRLRRHRRRARRRARRRHRLRHLPRRRPHQPLALLPRHRPGADPGRRRAGGHRADDRSRGRLAGAGHPRVRPVMAGAPRHPHLLRGHRRPGHPAVPRLDDGHRLAGLRDPDGRRRAVAGPRPQGPRPATRRLTAPPRDDRPTGAVPVPVRTQPPTGADRDPPSHPPPSPGLRGHRDLRRPAAGGLRWRQGRLEGLRVR
ncbi:hypothetical protein SCOCK_20005 [Actinacidiphila cocklensis]|uniref:Uncharacterized protein n=1 Tax=Actinacidiphila cocklensis TaxID=887465 RepID=A0A9W4DN15_9ACTN|nr:hypothetical protein SCOCK_20005 [Actinacidiphila cocklensis]